MERWRDKGKADERQTWKHDANLRNPISVFVRDNSQLFIYFICCSCLFSKHGSLKVIKARAVCTHVSTLMHWTLKVSLSWVSLHPAVLSSRSLKKMPLPRHLKKTQTKVLGSTMTSLPWAALLCLVAIEGAVPYVGCVIGWGNNERRCVASCSCRSSVAEVPAWPAFTWPEMTFSHVRRLLWSPAVNTPFE